MNLLKLTQEVCDVAGYAIPSNFESLDYWQGRCRDWVIEAWVEIQTQGCSLWKFMKHRTSLDILINKSEYTFAELDIDNLSHFLSGDVRLFNDDKYISDLIIIDEDEMIKYQEITPSTNEPIYWANTSTGLSLYPTPDKSYTLKINFYEKPIFLEDSADIPNISDEHHAIISDLAVHKYSISDNNPEVEQQSWADYLLKLNRLSLDYCPTFSTSRGDISAYPIQSNWS